MEADWDLNEQKLRHWLKLLFYLSVKYEDVAYIIYWSGKLHNEHVIIEYFWFLKTNSVSLKYLWIYELAWL